MESAYTVLALYGSKNVCFRTDTVFLPISEVCDGTVSLTAIWLNRGILVIGGVVFERVYAQPAKYVVINNLLMTLVANFLGFIFCF